MNDVPEFKAAVAPTVTIEQINAEIVSTEIVKHISETGQVLRWAILTTRNGFAVTGDPSAAVCPENDDPEKGEFYAVENAKRKIWQLLAFELKTKVNLVEKAQPTKHLSESKTYVGQKVVYAKPMSRGAYCVSRDWAVPDEENAEDEGYIIEYPDSDGYITWSPKDVFERSYFEIGSFPAKQETNFIDRLKNEREELFNRICKLAEFLSSDQYENLDKDSQDLLLDQHVAMQKYLNILDERLSRFV